MKKHTQYRDLFNQSIPLPFKGLRGKRIDLKQVGTAAITFIICSMIVSIVIRDSHVFGVHKVFIMIGLTALVLIISNKIHTANYPFILFISVIVQFLIKRRRTKVAFQEVSAPSKKTYNWRVPYRDMVDTGEEIHYYMYPLHGVVRSIKGLTLRFHDATKLRYHPLTKEIKIKQANFENLQPQQSEVSRFTPTKMQVGAGVLKFVYQKKKIRAVYAPERRDRFGSD